VDYLSPAARAHAKVKKPPTKAEQAHMSKVAALGCVVCRNLGYGETPAAIHHIRTGQGAKRASHYEAIPLCPNHHQWGGYGVAFHAGKQAFEENFGSEIDLLKQVMEELGA
jgi:hypothetical protein